MQCLLSNLQGNDVLQPCFEALARGKPTHHLPSWVPLLSDPKLLQNITAPGKQPVWDPPAALAGVLGKGGCGSQATALLAVIELEGQAILQMLDVAWMLLQWLGPWLLSCRRWSCPSSTARAAACC